jgi:hypothetical protein
MGETTESGSRPGGVEEAKVPASDLGATVAVESVLVRDGGEGGFSTFEERITLTIDGQVHRLTTAPHPAYGHYPSRTPSGFDVPGGTLAVSRVDGGTWVEFSQATSGAYGSFGWKLGSCETISDPEVGVAPRGEARPGRAGYTG